VGAEVCVATAIVEGESAVLVDASFEPAGLVCEGLAGGKAVGEILHAARMSSEAISR
jgi:hypothetical protein